MSIFYGLTSLALLAGGAFPLQSEQPLPAAPTAQPPPQPSTTAAPSREEIAVVEAVRRATDGLDRLEGGMDAAAGKALLDEVNGFIDSVRSREPGHPRLAYLYGRVYVLIGRQGDAIDQLRRFVETPDGRNEWKAYRILGDLFVMEFPRLAKANYEKASTLNPTEPALAFGLSLCAYKLGAIDEAIRLAQQAVSTDGRKTVRYLANLANLYQAAERWDDAITDAEEAMKLAVEAVGEKPASHQALLTADGQYQQMIAILRTRARQSPDISADTYLKLATYIRERTSLAQRLALHDALTVLAAGVERTAPTTSPELLERYASALTEAGRTADAIAAFEQFLKADPGNTEATQQLLRLRAQPTP